METVFDLN